jgi:hypothetical protein
MSEFETGNKTKALVILCGPPASGKALGERSLLLRII